MDFLPTGGGGGSAPARTHAADSRLLANLIRAEKDSMGALAQATSALHTAASALAAWGAAEGSGGVGATADMASTSAAVAGLLHAVADSERTHVAAIDGYRAALKDVLAREDSIRDVLRDRDILVGRLIKASKKRVKDNRIDAQAEKINEAQRELRACETVLAAEQAALVGVKRRTFKEALTMRAKTMGDVGNSMVEAAQEAILLLDGFDSQRSNFYDDASTYPPSTQAPNQEFYPQQPQQIIQPSYDAASTFQDTASYAEPGYARSAQYQPSMYANAGLSGQQFFSSDSAGVPPGHEPYGATPVSEAPSVSVPGSTGFPSGSDSAPSLRGAVATPVERPSIPAPHRLNSQTGVATDAFFPPPLQQDSDPSPGVPGPGRDRDRERERERGREYEPNAAMDLAALKALPAPANEHTAPINAVGASGGAPVLPSSDSVMASPASAGPHLTLPPPDASTGPGGGHFPPSSSSIGQGPSSRISDHQLQHLSPEQQQQYFAQQRQFASPSQGSYQHAAYIPSIPPQHLRGAYYAEPFAPYQAVPPGLVSGHAGDRSPSGGVSPASYGRPPIPSPGAGAGAGLVGLGPGDRASTLTTNPAYMPHEGMYQPGTFQNSSSYQDAVQGITSTDDGSSTHSAGRPGSLKPASIFGRVTKLFRHDGGGGGGGGASILPGGHARRSSRSSSQSQPRERDDTGPANDNSSDDERYAFPTEPPGLGGGEGWHTRTAGNLRSIKGSNASGNRSFLARATNAVGGRGGAGGADSSSDEEAGTATEAHVNGQYSDAASARTGKRSLLGLGRMTGKKVPAAEGDAVGPGASSQRQDNDADVRRRVRESVVGAGIGHQPTPPKADTLRSPPNTGGPATAPATGTSAKRKVKKIKRPARPASRADSESSAAGPGKAGAAAAGGATASAGVTTVKRSTSMAAKPRTVTVTGDASTGVRHSRISSAGHGSAAGKRSSVAPLPAGKYAISNWVSSSKDVPSAAKAAQHNPKTRISTGHVTSLSGRQVEGFVSAPPEEVVDRDKTPRPRTASGSRPSGAKNARASSATPTATTTTETTPVPEQPLVVSAPPRARDLLNAPSYSGPKASAYVSPTSAGTTALRSGANVNPAGQPNYLTHYDPPTEDVRAVTATPTAGGRTRTASGAKKVVKRSATAIGHSPTAQSKGSLSAPTTPLPTTTVSSSAVKRHTSLGTKPTAMGKHVPASHDARPLSPALKAPAGPGRDSSPAGLAVRRKSVRMAPDTKFTEHTRPVSRTAKTSSGAGGVKKKKPATRHVSPAPIPPPVVTIPFQVTAPGSSIVRADEPGPIPLAPSLHSASPLPPRSRTSLEKTQALSTSRPASAPAPAPGPGFVARAPGSSLSGVGFIPSAPGSSVPRSHTYAHEPPKRRASNPASRPPASAGGPDAAGRSAGVRPASSAGWTTRIGSTLDDSSDEEEARKEGPLDEYTRARRAFSSASRSLGAATAAGGGGEKRRPNGVDAAGK